MTHNQYDLTGDVVKPIQQFFVESNILVTVACSQIVRRLAWQTQIPPSEIMQTHSKKEQSMVTQFVHELTNKHKNTSDESANNSNEIESEGTLPDINNEIIHPNLSNVLQRQIFEHKRKRTLSPPVRKQSPSEGDPFE